MLRRHTKIAFAGSLHFVTTVTMVRGDWFINDVLCENILKVFEGYRSKHGVHCLGYVLMPDHLHATLYQESEEAAVPRMIQGFKSLVSQKCRPAGYPAQALWRPRYDDVPLPGPNAVRTRLEYMHANPVRAGLVDAPDAYKWSSAGHYAGVEDKIVRIESPW
jgi:putative transposase